MKKRILSFVISFALIAMLLPVYTVTVSAAQLTPAGAPVFVHDKEELDYDGLALNKTKEELHNQVMYVSFTEAPSADTYLWFEIGSSTGSIYAVSLKCDGTARSFAWSFLNKSDFRIWAKRFGDDVDPGVVDDSTYYIRAFSSDSPIRISPIDHNGDVVEGVTEIAFPNNKNEVHINAVDDTENLLTISNVNYRNYASMLPQSINSFGIDEDNVMWTKFSEPVPDDAYDSENKLYTIESNGKTYYYQLDVVRPAHGSADGTEQHPRATAVPGNLIETQSGSDHYHAWTLGTGDDPLFPRDSSDDETMLGTYTVRWWLLIPSDTETTNAQIAACEDRILIDSRSVSILDLTFTINEQNLAQGHKFSDGALTNILAQTGDTLTSTEGDAGIQPSIDLVQGEPNVFLNGWRVTGSTDKYTSTYVPQPLSSSGNKLVLEADIGERPDWTWEVQDSDENSIEPETAPETGVKPYVIPPISFNDTDKDGEDDEVYEYGYETAPQTLTYYLVNKGNQELRFAPNGTHGDFEVRITPPQGSRMVKPGERATLTVRPKANLSAGVHKANIAIYEYEQKFGIRQMTFTFTVNPKPVKINPKGIEKEYGDTKSASDVQCTVTDAEDNPMSDLTAQMLGVTLSSEGFAPDTNARDEVYPYIIDMDNSGGNYIVTLATGESSGSITDDEGVKVVPATPLMEAVNASGLDDGGKLSQSVLMGRYKNGYTNAYVDGDFSWNGDPNKQFDLDADMQPKVFSEEYTFTPKDAQNYKTVIGTTEIIVSKKSPTELYVSPAQDLNPIYNGQPQTVDFICDRRISDEEKVEYRPSVFSGGTDDDWTTEPPIDAGVYEVRATLPESVDYAPGLASAVLNIQPRTIQLSYTNPIYDKIYDGSAAAQVNASNVQIFNKAMRTLPQGDVTDDIRISDAAFSAYFDLGAESGYDKDVTVNVDGSVEGALVSDTPNMTNNYVLPNSTFSAKASIMQRQVNVKVNKIVKEYGQTHTISLADFDVVSEEQPEYGGLAAGDTKADIHPILESDGFLYSTPVGTYDITGFAYPLKNNYTFTGNGGSLGTAEVIKNVPSQVYVSAETGLSGAALGSVNITGTFVNKYTNAYVHGSIEWDEPDSVLGDDESEYAWTFTPEDDENYETVHGSTTVKTADIQPAPMNFEVTNFITFDGREHKGNLTTSVIGAQTRVEYRKISSVEIIGEETPVPDSTDSTGDIWTETAPSDVGTYAVKATVYAQGNFSPNERTDVMIIDQLRPSGGVTAGPVDAGSLLVDSVLTHTFKDINNQPVEGLLTWARVGCDMPDAVVAAEGIPYRWNFIPSDHNYRAMTATTLVPVALSHRAAQSEIYNLPSSDYAYVDVDQTNVKTGDSVTFYRDADATDPVSSTLTVTDEMHGNVRVALDKDALKKGGGTLYVKINGSSVTREVTYDPEIDFTLDPLEIYVSEGDSADVTVIPSSDVYKVDSVSWTTYETFIAEAAAKEGGEVTQGVVKGVREGEVKLDVTVTFKHPDPSAETNTLTINKTASVTVTDEEPPTYNYTTKDATEISETSAVLNGRVDITTAEGSSLTPHAEKKFILWEKNDDNRVLLGDDATASESVDYSLAIDGLKPGTTYVYRAAGSGLEASETKEFTTLDASAKYYIVSIDLNPASSGVTVSVAAENAKPAILVTAAYGEKGELLGVAQSDISRSDTIPVTLDLSGAKTVKAFVWDGLSGDGLKPLAQTKAINI